MLGCGRWVWKYFKGPFTPNSLTILPKQIVTWPPGVAPEPNCITKICCNLGSTHPPTISFSIPIIHVPSQANSTTWIKLKSIEGQEAGVLSTLYKRGNNGVDPRKCYNTKELEPAMYECTHIEPLNSTHNTYTSHLFNLSSPQDYSITPKPFVWTKRREGMYCVGRCEADLNLWTGAENCTWTRKYCFNLTTCGYHKPTQCPNTYPVPLAGLIRGNINKTLLHDVNLVMVHVSYNISNILSAYLTHCKAYTKTYTWLKTQIEDLVYDYKSRLAVQIPYSQSRMKRDLFSDITGLFGSSNSLINTYQISKQSQYTSWLTNQFATGFQHLTNGEDNIIKAVKSEAQALLHLSHMIFNQTHTLELDFACRSYAQDLFTATRQEVLDLRFQKSPRHALADLIEMLDLDRWFKSISMKTIYYAELLTTIMMYNGNECPGCIGFYATYPFIHPEQIFPDSTTIRSLGTVIRDQVVKWDQVTGYLTVKGSEMLLTTRSCCHETASYVICTCNTLQPVSSNDTKLINVHSLHGYSDAVQVSHTQWCVISEMTSFSYGGLLCPANHSFCLEVRDDFTMGPLSILGRIPMDTDVSPWWEDTFYEESTKPLTDTVQLVQHLIQTTSYHLRQSQVEVHLASETVRILTSASTLSAEYMYTWWDWVFRGCVLASSLILAITLIQFCYFRKHITALRSTMTETLTLGSLNVSTFWRP
ncbi:uncharacterized protein LOC143487784 [Brachyhypopomus gauderio]|uniref:uncharacterized protein LOC143487784 n=1 Tax=Brachyhypopomus gauderio TaxID=698409 RepID=UPI004041DF44